MQLEIFSHEWLDEVALRRDSFKLVAESQPYFSRSCTDPALVADRNWANCSQPLGLWAAVLFGNHRWRRCPAVLVRGQVPQASHHRYSHASSKKLLSGVGLSSASLSAVVRASVTVARNLSPRSPSLRTCHLFWVCVGSGGVNQVYQ